MKWVPWSSGTSLVRDGLCFQSSWNGLLWCTGPFSATPALCSVFEETCRTKQFLSPFAYLFSSNCGVFGVACRLEVLDCCIIQSWEWSHPNCLFAREDLVAQLLEKTMQMLKSFCVSWLLDAGKFLICCEQGNLCPFLGVF